VFDELTERVGVVVGELARLYFPVCSGDGPARGWIRIGVEMDLPAISCDRREHVEERMKGRS
jgi:hypothetical protein